MKRLSTTDRISVGHEGHQYKHGDLIPDNLEHVMKSHGFTVLPVETPEGEAAAVGAGVAGGASAPSAAVLAEIEREKVRLANAGEELDRQRANFEATMHTKHKELDELIAEAKAAEERRNSLFKGLRKLDTTNDDQWEEDGAPKLAVVGALAGLTDVTREEVDTLTFAARRQAPAPKGDTLTLKGKDKK